MRLIDADALAEELIKWRDNDPHRKNRSLIERWVRKTEINVVLKGLAAFPTVETELVKHGQWIAKQEPLSWCEDDVDVFFECSACGTQNFGESPYCPTCGARMDGDNNA